MSGDTNQRTLRCSQCNASFNCQRHMDKHMEGHKANNCQMCDTLMSTRKQYTQHMLIRHDIVVKLKNIQCKYCDKRFLKKLQLYYHYKKEHADTMTVCFKCGMFLKSEEVKSHNEKHEEEGSWKCTICKPTEIFSRKQQYLYHMKAHEKYKCEDCEWSFSTKAKLFRHSRIIHKKHLEDIAHICGTCGMKFSRPGLLNQHSRTHTGEKPFCCKDCNKQFISLKGFRKHLKLAHKDSMEGVDHNHKYKCDKCEETFDIKKELINHVEQPHLYNCEFCSYETCSKENAKRHIALHTESRRFICEQCGAAFFSLSNLQDHFQYVHSSDRSFKCPQCSSTFKTNSSLNRHIQTHSDVRPYGCYCGQTYKRISHLQRHQQSSHGPVKSRRLQRLERDKSGALIPVAEDKKSKITNKLKTDKKSQSQLDNVSSKTPVLSLFVVDSAHIFTLQQNCSTNLPEATAHQSVAPVDSYQTELLQTMQVGYEHLTAGLPSRDTQLGFNSVETVEQQYAQMHLHGTVEPSLLDEAFFTTNDERPVMHYQQNEINLPSQQSFFEDQHEVSTFGRVEI